MKTFLFGDYKIATAVTGAGKYGHTFGGPHDRKGTARENCGGILIHLLHRFDLTDPAIPITIPGVRWLPFYYCFDFRANDLGYRLVSEDELVTYFPDDDPHVSKEESWPGKDYPKEFPATGITVAPYAYDPTKLTDAFTWGGVFGVGKLSPRDQAKAKKRALDEMFRPKEPTTDEELLDLFDSPFAQGRPKGKCLNPDCGNHFQAGRLSTIALMPAEPVPGVHVFGEYGGDVTLIFQMCPKCYTIRVSNECT